MLKKSILASALVLMVGVLPASAQTQRVEIGATLGWTFSDGVTTDSAIPSGDGNVYTKIEPKDSVNWGFNVGIHADENLEGGFIFGQQMTTLAAIGTKKQDVGDLTVNTYHGYFAYNFLDSDYKVRPFLLFGLGATDFSDVTYRNSAGVSRTVDGLTRFSTTWGVGVKAFAGPHVGFKGGINWTPTYIKSDYAGWWCDPYWGCSAVGNVQYSSQWSFNGGIVTRF